MTKPDDDSQKKKEIDFFKPNYNQTYTGDEVQKYYYDSWEKFKIDVDFFKILRFLILIKKML